jgi:hypothetical protein
MVPLDRQAERKRRDDPERGETSDITPAWSIWPTVDSTPTSNSRIKAPMPAVSMGIN